MKEGYKDKTSEQAIGAADREWREMAKLALVLRERNNNKPMWQYEQEQRFTGIFRRLLEDPIEEVRKEAGRGYHA